jgi:glycosyltransferase involved in cell wall biosynthesis
MVVGIDASRYGHPEATGVEWYSFHLLNELIPLLGREHNTEIRLYAPADFKVSVDLPFNVKKRIIPFPRFWTVLRLSAEMVFKPVEMLFVPSHTLPMFAPKKSVITIHDVAFKHLKSSYSWFQMRLLDRSTRKAVKKAWKLIVPSEATKRDLVTFYRCDPAKIVVIPHGAPEVEPFERWSEAEIKACRELFMMRDRDLYVLYVGRLETKKNLQRLIEAFGRFSVEFAGWKLILAGKRGVGFEEIWKKVMDLKLEKSVFAPGYVTEREKSFLLENCRIFAFPSLYEGFGLPVLEAFAHRKPVLTSKTSSLPEVAGNAAYLVNPEKVEELSVGLKRLASDGILVTQLVGREAAQLQKFSWEKAAKETYETLFP